MITFLFAAFISALAITACSKKADAPGGGGGITKEKLVGTYKFAEIKWTPSGGTEEDILANENECQKDDLLQFKADMTLVTIDAGEQCSPSTDDTGSWEYKGGNTVVLNGTEFTIKSFVGSTLKMTSTENGTLNVTYEKQ